MFLWVSPNFYLVTLTTNITILDSLTVPTPVSPGTNGTITPSRGEFGILGDFLKLFPHYTNIKIKSF